MIELAQQTYYTERMAQYGITEANNTVDLWQYDAKEDKNVLTPFPIFTANEKGIEIMPFTLDRFPIKYAKEGSRWKNKHYSIIRLHPELVKPDGSIQKYAMPKGQGTPPLIPPSLIQAFESKTEIKTLYLTEGYFKAFKACMHDIPCIGLVSITCMIDKATGKLHGDILKIINTCKVQRVVWLTDADCRSISKDEITIENDLYKRVYGFYNSINKFQELLSAHDDLKLYFAHIVENLDSKSKGLDDLLINESSAIDAIKEEAFQFDKMSNGRYEGNYFVKFNITFGLSAVRNYFLINDVTQFYLHHVEIRSELKGKKFRFNGTLYSYDTEAGKCKIEIPKSAQDYFRVGDTYYEYIHIPNRYGELNKTYHTRQKSTINEDNGKEIFQHIAKYKAFCNTPDHMNYQRVISGCFNTYHPFVHVAEEGEFSQTLEFIKHIFGCDIIQLTNGNTVERWELGLDYLTILFKHPQQILPILCLVSEERQTGKTTFAKWLKQLFTENMAIVGNQDFENAFNAHWISKLLVCVDETKIDKDFVVEKIKSLSTSNYTMMNAKGKDQVEMETFLKFILLSNNEKNFISIDKQEIRFWVLKVPTIKDKVMDLEIHMLDEIPAFIHYINTRKMVTEYEERHWFKTEYLRTETLTKIQENSAPTLWKLIKSRVTIMFEEFDLNEFKMSTKDIREHLLKGSKQAMAEDHYIRDVLAQAGYTLSANSERGFFYKKVEVIGKDTNQGDFNNDGMLDSDNISSRTIRVNTHGKLYHFKREKFCTDGISAVQMDMPLAHEATETDLPF